MIIMIDDASEVEGSIFAFKCKGTRPIFRSFRFIFGRKCDINLIVLHIDSRPSKNIFKYNPMYNIFTNQYLMFKCFCILLKNSINSKKNSLDKEMKCCDERSDARNRILP